MDRPMESGKHVWLLKKEGVYLNTYIGVYSKPTSLNATPDEGCQFDFYAYTMRRKKVSYWGGHEEYSNYVKQFIGEVLTIICEF